MAASWPQSGKPGPDRLHPKCGPPRTLHTRAQAGVLDEGAAAVAVRRLLRCHPAAAAQKRLAVPPTYRSMQAPTKPLWPTATATAASPWLTSEPVPSRDRG